MKCEALVINLLNNVNWELLIDFTRLIERFLMDDYIPHQLSTYALTLFRYKTTVGQNTVSVGKY